jgi:hypothetical protein
VRRGLAVYGPAVPGRLMRWTPWGRARMRELLGEHVQEVRRAGASDPIRQRLAAELERYRSPRRRRR